VSVIKSSLIKQVNKFFHYHDNVKGFVLLLFGLAVFVMLCWLFYDTAPWYVKELLRVVDPADWNTGGG